MTKLKNCLLLFLAFFKIGIITFGGGYAMIAIIESELVEKKKWIKKNEFLDVIAIAESTPGPIAINSATFIGYKRGGFFGSLFATLGVVTPSFIIIFAISFVFEKFLSLKYVAYAFKGIQACVAYLILAAGIKMFKGLKKDIFNTVLFSLATAAMITLDILAVGFSSVYYILLGGLIGIAAYIFSFCREKRKRSAALADGKDNALKDENNGGLNLADGAENPTQGNSEIPTESKAQGNSEIPTENKTQGNAASSAQNSAENKADNSAANGRGESCGVRDKLFKEGKD